MANSFNDYCNSRISEIVLKQKRISEKLNEIRKNGLTMPKELKKDWTYKYFEENPKLIRYVSQSTLDRFYQEKITQEMLIDFQKLEQEIEELTDVQVLYHEGAPISGIKPTKSLIKNFINYASIYHLEADSFLTSLIGLFENQLQLDSDSKDNNEFEELIDDIKLSFNHNYKVKSEENLESLFYTFKALLNIVYDNNIPEDVLLYINQIKTKIKRDSLVNKVKEKHAKKATPNLQEYFQGARVIKTCPLDKLETMLDDTDLKPSIKSKYRALMEDAIAKEEFGAEDQDTILLMKYLTGEQFETLKNCYNNLYKENYPGIGDKDFVEFTKIIKRTMKDVVSICRYIEIEDYIEDKKPAYESLEMCMHMLETEVSYLNNPNKKKYSRLRYLLDEDNSPLIKRDIENSDIILYDDYFVLLKALANGAEGTKVDSFNNVGLFELSVNNATLVYAAIDNIIFVVGFKGLNEQLSDELKIKIVKSFIALSQHDNVLIQGLAEELIIDALNVNKLEYENFKLT